MGMSLACKCCTSLLLASAASMSASATAIVDTGPGPDRNVSVILGGGTSQALAGQFSTTQWWEISEASGWIYWDGLDGPVTFTLYSDDHGLPGSELFSRTLLLSVMDSPAWQGPKGLDWRIGPGTYWIAASNAAGATATATMPVGVANPLPVGAHSSVGGWVQDPLNIGWLIEAEAAPIPEPASLSSVLLGLAAVAIASRRRPQKCAAKRLSHGMSGACHAPANAKGLAPTG
jgi:PEP-CTERM motif